MTATADPNLSRTVLEARGLHVEFVARSGAVARAVDGVDLRVAAGEIVALVGESGSGKTTLARTLLGLERPSAGGVFLDDAPLDRSTRGLRAFRRRVQLVLQDPAGALNPRHTVYESVAEGIRLHRLAAADPQRRTEADLVATALSAAGLRPPERLFLRYPHELSGGQRQRVLIAGALAMAPQLLVADEPVSSLDASIRGEVLALLLTLRRELGLGVLVVTHDLGLAWNIADRIAVMYLGRIVESGPTEDVLREPQHPYTRALLSVVPEIERIEPIVLTGEVPDPTRVPSGCRFHPRCPAVADGTAAARGLEDACRRTPLAVVPVSTGHDVACHLVERTPMSDLEAALPRAMYVDETAWTRERDRVLLGSWTCVGRVDDLGLDRPGQVAVLDVLGESVVLTRDDDGLHGAYNVCRHRGSQLVPTEPGAAPVCAAVGALRCPYHSWTYSLAGSLLRAPHTDGVAIDPTEFSLHPVAVEAWEGFVFACLDPVTAPLAEGVAKAAASLGNYAMGDLVTGLTLVLRGAGQLEGGRRELQRVLPLRSGPPRAEPAGAGVRGRGRRPDLGGRHPAPRRGLDLHPERHHHPGAAAGPVRGGADPAQG